jgi:hypothetical protein
MSADPKFNRKLHSADKRGQLYPWLTCITVLAVTGLVCCVLVAHVVGARIDSDSSIDQKNTKLGVVESPAGTGVFIGAFPVNVIFHIGKFGPFYFFRRQGVERMQREVHIQGRRRNDRINLYFGGRGDIFIGFRCDEKGTDKSCVERGGVSEIRNNKIYSNILVCLQSCNFRILHDNPGTLLISNFLQSIFSGLRVPVGDGQLSSIQACRSFILSQRRLHDYFLLPVNIGLRRPNQEYSEREKDRDKLRKSKLYYSVPIPLSASPQYVPYANEESGVWGSNGILGKTFLYLIVIGWIAAGILWVCLVVHAFFS